MSDFTEVSYVIDANDHFSEVGGEWAKFARENGGEALAAGTMGGRSLWEFIVDRPTQEIYAALLARVRAGNDTEIELRCDAPDRRRRVGLRMSLLADDSIEFRSRLRSTEPRPWQAFLSHTSPRSASQLPVCSWCGLVEAGAAGWLEVEAALAALQLSEERLLPGLEAVTCPQCHAAYVASGREEISGSIAA